ncbi:efflux RND transporter periplasmic adaptor subunit [Stieleria mannarensis]|uniref:efflux RND transporter periplasmic adaptor subunit n=1 Tax=Stieleria mannarensis TaxID=2755585 RepID=UPI0015FFCDCE|nr:efflux RND transporter periplasmic adaptor subunit [Rhodopirellula sp. JC639]
MNQPTIRPTRCVLPLIVATVCVSTTQAQQQPPAPVAVAETVQMDVAAGQTFVATVMPLKRAVVGSAVDGRVVELVVHEGERVAQGGTLAKLLTATIELELAAAQAELDLRNQELAELEAGSRPNEIEQAKAKMLAAKAEMEFGQAQLLRLQQLRKSNSASPEEFELVKSQASQREQVYLELKAAYDLMVEGPRTERIAQARAQVAFQQAMVDRIQDRIKKYTIMSRFDGYVVTEHVDEGTWVQSGDPVMEVVALDEVEVYAYVVEQHAAHITPGMTVRVDVPALPDELFTGQITTVIPQADAKARTFPVKIRVPNTITDSGPLLKAGMYARVQLPVGPPQRAVMVPKNALVLGGPQPLVYVVENGEGNSHSVRPVPIRVGVAMPNLIQAIGPLEAGQLVVVEGNERLRPGQSVRISRVVKPASTPETDQQTEGASDGTD